MRDCRESASTHEVVDLLSVAGSGGVCWSVSPGGLNANLVVLAGGESIATHRNDELDVLVVVLAGEARIVIDGEAIVVTSPQAVVIPRATTRSITAGDDGARYLTVHAQRSPLSIGATRSR